MTPEEIRRLLTKEPHWLVLAEECHDIILSLLHVIERQREALEWSRGIISNVAPSSFDDNYSVTEALAASAEYAALAREQLSGKEET